MNLMAHQQPQIADIESEYLVRDDACGVSTAYLREGVGLRPVGGPVLQALALAPGLVRGRRRLREGAPPLLLAHGRDRRQHALAQSAGEVEGRIGEGLKIVCGRRCTDKSFVTFIRR